MANVDEPQKGQRTFPQRIRRLRRDISELLSPEAKLAMLQVQEETPLPQVPVQEREKRDPDLKEGSVVSNNEVCHENPKSAKLSFLDVYEKRDIQRLEGDITDGSSIPVVGAKRCIGGGNLLNAMEIVETVVCGEETYPDIDETEMEDKARLASVEKCLVWFDAQRDTGLFQPMCSRRVDFICLSNDS